MSIIYYIKELIYNLIMYIFFVIATTFYLINHKLVFYIYQEKNVNTNILYNLFSDIPNKIYIKKLDWYNNIHNKNIVHIEYYTLETIYYKTLIFYFLITTLLFLIFIICKWKFNISYQSEKQKYIITYIVIIYFCFSDYYYSTLNTTNIKNILIGIEKKKYFNLYLEPQITIESLLDTKIFFFCIVIFKYFICYIFFIYKKNINFFYRYIIICFIFFFIHIDFLYIIYSILEVEVMFILLRTITFYFDGDDRN